jgi:hypothetical protein
MTVNPDDTMQSLFEHNIFAVILEMAGSSESTFQRRGCQLLGKASRRGQSHYPLYPMCSWSIPTVTFLDWPKFEPPARVTELLGTNLISVALHSECSTEVFRCQFLRKACQINQDRRRVPTPRGLSVPRAYEKCKLCGHVHSEAIGCH